VGALDPPPGGATLRRGAIAFGGWTHFRSGPAARVELRLGDQPLGRARLGLRRTDACDALGLPVGAATGFELLCDLSTWPGGEGELELTALATGLRGERLELGPHHVRVAAPEQARMVRPTPPLHQRVGPPSGRGLRTLVVTHRLDRGGAQLYLQELLAELVRGGTVDPVVVSAEDGPLRAELEALAVEVHVTGTPPFESLDAHRDRVGELAAWAGEGGFEVAFVNTATGPAYFGVDLAAALGIPVLWSIHESYPPAVLWSGMHPELLRHAEAALTRAERTVFAAESTRRLLAPHIAAERSRTIPYGLEFGALEARRAGFDRAAARRAAGISAEADVLLCVGTVEPRKAQLPLAQAFELVAARHPRAELIYVGARPGEPDTDFLTEYAAASPAARRIRVVPMTDDVHSWFGLADLFVCAADVESLPRTVVEAQAWELPVLATAIFGLPELVVDGETGWLCEPLDLEALAAGLDRALASSPEQRRRLGRNARAQVLARHDLPTYATEISALIAELAGRPARALA